MGETRNVSLGVYYRIWGILRQKNWWYQVTDVSLNLDTRTNAPAHSYCYSNDTRPYVFVDEFNEVWPSGVKVYLGGIPQPSGTYAVDYINARVTFPASPSGSVSADLAIFNAIVREGYPEDEELVLLDLPVIAYEVKSEDKEWFAIGLGYQKKQRDIVISIMARNQGERQDLTDDISTNVRFVPYVEYCDHKPLNETFGLDFGFSYADQFVDRLIILGDIQGDYLRPRPGGSDKERYRSMIAFQVERIS